MSNEVAVTIVGNLTADPELRFTPSGAAVANFTVAQTPRVKQGDEWVDGTAMFFNCAVWRDYAENVVESLQKGQRVIVQGRMTVREWESNGKSGRSNEIAVDEVGHSLRFGSASYQKKGGGSQGGQQRGQQQRPQSSGQRPQQRQQAPQQTDPWASGPAAGPDPWGGQEPPY